MGKIKNQIKEIFQAVHIGYTVEKEDNMKYYIVKENKWGKEYKRYKCIDGFSSKKELCWKFSKQGALSIIERLKYQYRIGIEKNGVKFYLEEAE